MVVGRAVNGWFDPWRAADVRAAEKRRAIVDRALGILDNGDPMKWVAERWGDVENDYNTRRSQFWRTVRAVVNSLQVVPPELEARWPSFVIWSNLCKVAPFDRGNPPSSLRAIQYSACLRASGTGC
jgi:hypothetical protein